MKTIMELYVGDDHVGRLIFEGKDIWAHSRLSPHAIEVQKAMSQATIKLLEGLKPLWEQSEDKKRG
jgi:hypothetical protein